MYIRIHHLLCLPSEHSLYNCYFVLVYHAYERIKIRVNYHSHMNYVCIRALKTHNLPIINHDYHVIIFVFAHKEIDSIHITVIFWQVLFHFTASEKPSNKRQFTTITICPYSIICVIDSIENAIKAPLEKEFAFIKGPQISGM